MEVVIPKILCVDDEPNILQAFKRQLKGKFDLEVASDPQVALDTITTRGPFSVILTDMRMPGLDGIQFLAEVEKRAPDAVRVMLSGNGDRATPVKAINEGKVFKFLSKPCSIDELEKALREAHSQYQLQRAERELLNNTLGGCIKLLTDVLSLLAPERFTISRRARELSQELLPLSGLKGAWEINLAIMLADIGMVTIPAELQVKSRSAKAVLSADEYRILDELPQISASLLANIPRLERVGEAVLYQNKRFDGGGFPSDAKRAEEIPASARFLKIVRRLATAEIEGISRVDAFRAMLAAPQEYDTALVKRLISPATENEPAAAPTQYAITVKDLCVGQILRGNIVDKDGRLLIAGGATVTEVMVTRLQNYAALVGIVEPILVDSRLPTRREAQ